MDADGERLLKHIKMCHQIIAHLSEILEVLLEHVGFDNPLMQNNEDYRRIEDIIATIRRATNKPKPPN